MAYERKAERNEEILLKGPVGNLNWEEECTHRGGDTCRRGLQPSLGGTRVWPL